MSDAFGTCRQWAAGLAGLGGRSVLDIEMWRSSWWPLWPLSDEVGGVTAAGSQGGGMFPPCRDRGEVLAIAAQPRHTVWWQSGEGWSLQCLPGRGRGSGLGIRPEREEEVIPRGAAWSLGP